MRSKLKGILGMLLILQQVLLGSASAAESTVGDPSDLANRFGPVLRKELLNSPDTINRVVRRLIADDSPLTKFLDTADLRLKVFDSPGPDRPASLGISYALSKDIVPSHYFREEATRHEGLTLNASARGNIAFDRQANPRDFLDAKLNFLGFMSRGGAIKAPADVAEKLNDIEDRAADLKTREDLLHDEGMREGLKLARSYLTTQVYGELGVNAGIESDQSFSTNQYFYGAHLAVDIKAWNPASALAKFNFLDYPFAFTRRYVFRTDADWTPTGSTLPLFIFGIDHVLPDSDHPRRMVGDSSDFARFRFETSFRTMVGHIKNQATFFEANLRHYRELNATSAVKDAGLDQSTVITLVLQLPKGAYVSYSNGKLPFDVRQSQVYEAGFRYSF